jgi:hypothetical protein
VEKLTYDERMTIARYLTEPRGRADTFFSYATYFVPSVLFALYGMIKTDLLAVAVGYVVLIGLVIYLISYQRRTGKHFRSALRKLVEDDDPIKGPAAETVSAPPS